MTAQKSFKGILIFLIVAHVLCSCLSGTQKICSRWDTSAHEMVQVVEPVTNFPWETLAFSVVQIVLLLCNRNILQLFAAIGASGYSLIMPMRVHVQNLINENIYYILTTMIPRDTYKLSITPMGYAAMALSVVIVACSIFLAVKYGKKRQPSEEIRQGEESDGAAV